MSRFSQIIRSLSTVSKKQIPNNNNNFIKKLKKLNINDENDYNTIKSIIHSSCGALKFDEKNGKFYFK